MTKLYVILKTLKGDSRGVSAIEYGLLAAAIAAGLVIILGDATSGGFLTALADKFGSILATAPVTP